MPIEWNKVTWYSKLIAVILFVAVFYVGFRLGTMKKEIYTAPATEEKITEKKTPTPISIKNKDIKEENFTGTVVEISGVSTLAVKARAFVEETVLEFKKQADTDVPLMRTDFGEESPSANYEINIEAKHLNSAETESIVFSIYTYTGGAHGSSIYKTFTAAISDGEILSLSSVVKKEKQTAFTEFLKKQLIAWRPSVSQGEPMIFTEDVEDLKFSALEKWSLDDKNLVIYFDQYEIGPGVLGAVAFPLTIEKIKDFLE